MTPTIWLVVMLSISLPSDYRLEGNTSERIGLPGPPGFYATQEFRSWQAPEGKKLYLFVWTPRPPRDLGPMEAASEWPALVAGQKTKIIETSRFMGRQQRVLVTHLRFSNPEAQAMFYASGLNRTEFEAVLAGVAPAPAPQ